MAVNRLQNLFENIAKAWRYNPLTQIKIPWCGSFNLIRWGNSQCLLIPIVLGKSYGRLWQDTISKGVNGTCSQSPRGRGGGWALNLSMHHGFRIDLQTRNCSCENNVNPLQKWHKYMLVSSVSHVWHSGAIWWHFNLFGRLHTQLHHMTLKQHLMLTLFVPLRWQFMAQLSWKW